MLVFGVLLIEFRRFAEPIAIVIGSVLALSGAIIAFWLTGTTLNIISLLGAIIGLGITAKNGILMLDYVDHLRVWGIPLVESLMQSGSTPVAAGADDLHDGIFRLIAAGVWRWSGCRHAAADGRRSDWLVVYVDDNVAAGDTAVFLHRGATRPRVSAQFETSPNRDHKS